MFVGIREKALGRARKKRNDRMFSIASGIFGTISVVMVGFALWISFQGIRSSKRYEYDLFIAGVMSQQYVGSTDEGYKLFIQFDNGQTGLVHVSSGKAPPELHKYYTVVADHNSREATLSEFTFTPTTDMPYWHSSSQ